MQHQRRQLAAILFTDIVGYTAMMQKNETQAVVIVKRYISVLRETVSEHAGEVLNDYGDGSLCTFSSATEAVQCAISMQQQLQISPAVPLRIGLHVGEIFFEDGKVLGDGVNVASRIQSLGQANTILFSKEVCDKIRNQPEFRSVSLGRFEFKNVDEPVEVFALANEGLVVPQRKTMEGKLKEIKNNSARKKWIVTTTIVLLLAAAFFIYKNINHSPGFTGDEKSIAVIPFENMGADNTDEYISDGITQDIINNLSRISSLQKVIGWFSVKGFKKTTKSVREIADELGVAAILTGTIEMRLTKIHIIAELIDVNTNKRLWGEDYDYDSSDILSIQSKVALQIATALRANLTPNDKKNISKLYTENVEAYKYYVRGRNFWNARGAKNFDSAEANFKRAIKLDPNYALAYAGIADCYTYNAKGMSQLEAIPVARGYANQALSLDSNLSEGLTSLGFIQFNFDYEWARAKRTLERAIELDPNNPTAHLYYGNLLQYSGSSKRGLEECEKSVQLDPLAYGANWVLGRNYYFAGQNDKAIEQFRKTLLITPKQQLEIVVWSMGLAYFENKMYVQAKEQFDKISECEHSSPIDYYPIMQGYGYALLGDTTKAKEFLDKALGQKGNIWLSPYRLSEVYAALGDYNEALHQLEEGYQQRDLHMFWIKVDPGLNPIRNEQRFKDILKKMNLQ